MKEKTSVVIISHGRKGAEIASGELDASPERTGNWLCDLYHLSLLGSQTPLVKVIEFKEMTRFLSDLHICQNQTGSAFVKHKNCQYHGISTN